MVAAPVVLVAELGTDTTKYLVMREATHRGIEERKLDLVRTSMNVCVRTLGSGLRYV